MNQPLGVSERPASSNSFSPPTARRKAALASAQLLDLAMEDDGGRGNPFRSPNVKVGVGSLSPMGFTTKVWTKYIPGLPSTIGKSGWCVFGFFLAAHGERQGNNIVWTTPNSMGNAWVSLFITLSTCAAEFLLYPQKSWKINWYKDVHSIFKTMLSPLFGTVATRV